MRPISDLNKRGLAAWLPVLVWCAVIFTMSTSAFSATNTWKIIDPILHWMFRNASVVTLMLLHGLIRKSAHFFEYCVLFWLLARGPLAGRPYFALALCVVYAILDETHQVFVPGRTPSAYDVALDSTGALFSRFLTVAITELA